MNTSRNILIGIIIIAIGVSIFFKTIGLDIHLGVFIGPLIFFLLGIIFYRKQNRFLSILFLGIGLFTLFDNVFDINIGGIIVGFIFIFFGYRLLKGKKKEEASIEASRDFEQTCEPNVTSPHFRSSFIGDIRLLNNRFELEDMTIRNGIGDVKIDLSKAIISEGETVIVINGIIGNIDIYVPYDLEVSVQGIVTIGDLHVFDHRMSGFNRQLSIATKDYKTSLRRVKLVLSLFIGDIDVRYVS